MKRLAEPGKWIHRVTAEDAEEDAELEHFLRNGNRSEEMEGTGGKWREANLANLLFGTNRPTKPKEKQRSKNFHSAIYLLCLPASLCSKCAARAAVQPVGTRSEQEEQQRRAFLGWIARFPPTQTVRLWRLWRVSGRYRTAPFFVLIRSWFSSHTEAARNQIKLQLLTANFNALWLAKSLTQMFHSNLEGQPFNWETLWLKIKTLKILRSPL